MTKIRLPYVLEYSDCRGKVRRYFRRRGYKQVALPGVPGSDEFMAAYQAALAQTGALAVRFSPGSMSALITSYLKSDSFIKALSPDTQGMRRNILD